MSNGSPQRSCFEAESEAGLAVLDLPSVPALMLSVAALMIAGLLLGHSSRLPGALPMPRSAAPLLTLAAWSMLFPLLVNAPRPRSFGLRQWRCPLVVTFLGCWVIKPALAMLLALLMGRITAGAGPGLGDGQAYASALLFLSVAPSTAAVLVWMTLADADTRFGLVAMLLADLALLLVAAPLLGVMFGLSALVFPLARLGATLALYLTPPLGASLLLGYLLSHRAEAVRQRCRRAVARLMVPGVLLLVAGTSFQAGRGLRDLDPAASMLVFALVLKALATAATVAALGRRMGLPWGVTQAAALVAASTFLPFTHGLVAGLNGDEAPVTRAVDLGCALETPVMLLVVAELRALQRWYLGRTWVLAPA